MASFQSTAKKFSADRKDNLSYRRPLHTRELITPEEAIGKVATALMDERNMEKYVEAMKLSDIDVDRAMVSSILARTMFSTPIMRCPSMPCPR